MQRTVKWSLLKINLQVFRTELCPLQRGASIRAPIFLYHETRIQNPASRDGKVYGENRIVV
jgi:hypothetical protein